MNSNTRAARVDRSVRSELAAVYEEVMWLATRRGVTPAAARSWYTHVAAVKLSRRIRQFSGKVSRKAVADPSGVLRLEHHARIQNKLTELVAAHLRRKKPSPTAFVRLVLESESVHIVTFAENYAARKHGGDYQKAGIRLVAWRSIPKARRELLWRKMLRGKVANADAFAG